MVYYDYSKDKVNNDYQKLLTMYETADDKKKLELYSELKWFLSFVNNKKIDIEVPYGYDDYCLDKQNKRREVLKKYNELTKILLNNWYVNIVNMSCEYYNYSKNYITKEEFEKRVIDYFKKYFPNDINLVLNAFNDNKIFLRKRIFGTKEDSSIKYFDYLKDYYIKMISGNKLNVYLVQSLIHELGHAIHYNEMNKNSINNIFGELISTLYEVKYLEDITKSNNRDISSEQIHLIKNVGQVDTLYAYANDSCSNNFLVTPYGFDLVQRLYAHIIYLTLYERGSDEYMKGIKLFKENANLEPLEQLSKVGISEDDLIKTSSCARKILHR